MATTKFPAAAERPQTCRPPLQRPERRTSELPEHADGNQDAPTSANSGILLLPCALLNV